MDMVFGTWNVWGLCKDRCTENSSKRISKT